MLTYELISNNAGIVRYKYFPENEGVFGVVEFNAENNSFIIVDLAPNDFQGDYARKFFSRIRKFSQQQTFRAQGTIAWC